MKIIKLETFAIPDVGLLKMTTDTGNEGWGQIATYESADLVARVLHRQVSPVALGKDPYEQEELNDLVIEENLKFPGSFICRALAAIDTAIWDMKGKISQKPVYELLGATGKPVDVYGSSMSREITPEDEAARMKKLANENGYRAFKLRVGTSAGRNEDAWPGRTEKIIPTVRKALGDQITIHADANSCYTPDCAGDTKDPRIG